MRPLPTLTVGLLLTAAISFAQVSGTVWENVPDASNAQDPANMASTLASATFTSTGIFYCSDQGEAGCPATAGYNVAAFLNNPTFSNQQNGFSSTAALNNTEVQLTGTVFLTAGANSFNMGHDDGATLQITGGPGSTNCPGTQSGSLCVDVPGPTPFDSTPFTIDATTTGNYTFTLNYAECCGAPAYLLLAYPSGRSVGSNPEPSSIVLFSTTLLGGAWLVRRRRKAV